MAWEAECSDSQTKNEIPMTSDSQSVRPCGKAEWRALNASLMPKEYSQFVLGARVAIGSHEFHEFHIGHGTKSPHHHDIRK